MCHLGIGILAGGPSLVPVRSWLVLALLMAISGVGRAQWITQTNSLRPGWNSVFLHLDASHATLDELVGNDLANPIQEIWHWRPPLPTGQFIESPQLPLSGGSQWASWTRLSGSASTLRRLVGNGAYLVRVASDAPPFIWRVKGKPVAPTYRWTMTGLNFIGFPTPRGPTLAQPFFEAFLAPAPELQQTAEIYRYQGGELGPTNPVRVLALRNTRVQSDQAYWIRAGQSFNQYFGPFQIAEGNLGGIHFRDTRSQTSLRLRNVVNSPLTVTLRQVASESGPPGQPASVGPPVLLVRGSINPANRTYGYTILEDGPSQWTLAPAGQPGSEVEVVLGLARIALAGNPGDRFESVLRFTDSLGLSQVDLGVSAEKASTAGLWVGGATVNSVSHQLTPYARATNQADFEGLLTRLQLGQGVNGFRYEWDANTGRVLVFGGPEQKTGSYLVDGPIKTDPGTVARPYPLRLILHNDGSTTRLLQKVFHGLNAASNTVLTTRESLLLPARLSEARRISAVHLPTSPGNIPWTFSGAMSPGTTITANVPLSHDDHASNPFLHTYHPDHDNLDPLFSASLPRGVESYGVDRRIALTFSDPDDDFESLTGSSQDFGGRYAETITIQARGSQTRTYNVLGSFSLKRLSDIPTLTTN